MTIENRKCFDSHVDQLFSIGVHQEEYGQLGECHDDKPDKKLYGVHSIVDMFVELLPCVSINILRIMNRKVNPTLQDKNVILLGKVKNNGMNKVSQHQTKSDFTDEVDEVPFATITFVDFKLQVNGECKIQRMCPAS